MAGDKKLENITESYFGKVLIEIDISDSTQTFKIEPNDPREVVKKYTFSQKQTVDALIAEGYFKELDGCIQEQLFSLVPEYSKKTRKEKKFYDAVENSISIYQKMLDNTDSKKSLKKPKKEELKSIQDKQRTIIGKLVDIGKNETATKYAKVMDQVLKIKGVESLQAYTQGLIFSAGDRPYLK